MESPETAIVTGNKAPEVTIPPVPPSPKKMDQSMVRSLAWRATTSWISQFFSWISLLIVVRKLLPADFGIVAMAVTLLPYLRYVGELGIPATIVNLRDISDDQLAQLNTIAVFMGVGCFGLGALLAKPMGIFFRTPQVTSVVIVVCSSLIFMGLRAVPEGLLAKEMRFGLISWCEVVNSLVATASTLLLALFGFGYWSLVWGNVLATIARSAMIIASRPFRFAMPRFSFLQRELKFGWHVLVSVVALNSYQRLDNATSGRVLGQTALGFYGMAWNLANVPLEKVTSLVTTVVPTYLAAIQNDAAALRRYVRTITEALALVTFPTSVGLGLVANELIPIALGRKWGGVIVPLEILSIYAAFRSIVALIPKVLTAVGNARFVMWNDLYALVLLPTSFVIGSRWGNNGIAWAWVVAYPLVAFPLYRKTFRTIEMKTSEYIRAARPALDGTLVMSAAVVLFRRLAPLHSLSARLVLEVLLGAAVYVAVLLLFHRERVMAFVRLAKSVRERKKAAKAPATT